MPSSAREYPRAGGGARAMGDELTLEKIDGALFAAVKAYRANTHGAGHDDDGISVTLRFAGDLGEIEALGFETHSASAGEARGVVRFKDVGALIAHRGVLWMAAGRRSQVTLDTAARDVRARASAPVSGAPADGLWHVAPAPGGLTHAPNATGAGVIVAILDTGIDFKHPMFMSQLTPAKRTRILRIWDQGMTPAALADCPAQRLLESAGTYGVEFDDVEINAALNGGPAVDHRDCDGHGTHVAGIAAGGVPPGGDTRFVGVAPEASIVAVKVLDVPQTIRFRTASGFGAQVGEDTRILDAVAYCLRFAAGDPHALPPVPRRPVVINMSIGNASRPGDSLDDLSRWVDERLNPAAAADANHFPSGAVVVHSSGNEADPGRQTAARIVIPASGQVIVPFVVADGRGVNNVSRRQCVNRVHDSNVGAAIWYRRPTGAGAVRCAVRLPHQTGFERDIDVGDFFDQGFVIHVGGAHTTLTAPAANVHRVFLEHEGNAPVPHPAGGSVHRHLILLTVRPKRSGSTVTYPVGDYQLRLTGPVGTELFLIAWWTFLNAGGHVSFDIADRIGENLPRDPAIDVGPEHTIVDGLGRHAITVAAYDDADGSPTIVTPRGTRTRGHIASFSSRGPLRNFAPAGSGIGVVADKPDLAAPGVNITSAGSIDRPPPFATIVDAAAFHAGSRFRDLGGTSQATPMVAGTIALMLQKRPTLNTTQVRAALQAAAATRPPVSPAPGIPGTRAYGAGMLDTLGSHTRVP